MRVLLVLLVPLLLVLLLLLLLVLLLVPLLREQLPLPLTSPPPRSYRLCPASEPLTEACFQKHPLDFVQDKQQLVFKVRPALHS